MRGLFTRLAEQALGLPAQVVPAGGTRFEPVSDLIELDAPFADSDSSWSERRARPLPVQRFVQDQSRADADSARSPVGVPAPPSSPPRGEESAPWLERAAQDPHRVPDGSAMTAAPRPRPGPPSRDDGAGLPATPLSRPEPDGDGAAAGPDAARGGPSAPRTRAEAAPRARPAAHQDRTPPASGPERRAVSTLGLPAAAQHDPSAIPDPAPRAEDQGPSATGPMVRPRGATDASAGRMSRATAPNAGTGGEAATARKASSPSRRASDDTAPASGPSSERPASGALSHRDGSPVRVTRGAPAADEGPRRAPHMPGPRAGSASSLHATRHKAGDDEAEAAAPRVGFDAAGRGSSVARPASAGPAPQVGPGHRRRPQGPEAISATSRSDAAPWSPHRPDSASSMRPRTPPGDASPRPGPERYARVWPQAGPVSPVSRQGPTSPAATGDPDRAAPRPGFRPTSAAGPLAGHASRAGREAPPDAHQSPSRAAAHWQDGLNPAHDQGIRPAPERHPLLADSWSRFARFEGRRQTCDRARPRRRKEDFGAGGPGAGGGHAHGSPRSAPPQPDEGRRPTCRRARWAWQQRLPRGSAGRTLNRCRPVGPAGCLPRRGAPSATESRGSRASPARNRRNQPGPVAKLAFSGRSACRRGAGAGRSEELVRGDASSGESGLPRGDRPGARRKSARGAETCGRPRSAQHQRRAQPCAGGGDPARRPRSGLRGGHPQRGAGITTASVGAASRAPSASGDKDRSRCPRRRCDRCFRPAAADAARSGPASGDAEGSAGRPPVPAGRRTAAGRAGSSERCAGWRGRAPVERSPGFGARGNRLPVVAGDRSSRFPTAVRRSFRHGRGGRHATCVAFQIVDHAARRPPRRGTGGRGTWARRPKIRSPVRAQRPDHDRRSRNHRRGAADVDTGVQAQSGSADHA